MLEAELIVKLSDSDFIAIASTVKTTEGSEGTAPTPFCGPDK